VIGLPRGVSVYAFVEPCYMRKSFDALTALVTERMGYKVLTGDLFLFVGRDRRRAKVLYFDGTGMPVRKASRERAVQRGMDASKVEARLRDDAD
jgi:transposase